MIVLSRKAVGAKRNGGDRKANDQAHAEVQDWAMNSPLVDRKTFLDECHCRLRIDIIQEKSIRHSTDDAPAAIMNAWIAT